MVFRYVARSTAQEEKNDCMKKKKNDCMKKIVFRDHPFYVDVFIHPDYLFIGSFITVYTKRERTGFLSFLGPKYIQVYRTDDISRVKAQSMENLIAALTTAWEIQQDNVVECIQCSPEIE